MAFQAFQFKISLAETKAAVWRRLIVPEDYIFFQLHLAIQGAFGWENGHSIARPMSQADFHIPPPANLVAIFVLTESNYVNC